MTSSPAVDTARHYRFAGVELDVANYRLKVDGRARDCSRKAFEFLLILCRAGNRLLSRDELIAELWPGGQVISDEALTQVIFRARIVIGDYGSLIVTKRGLGLRLDAAVSRSSEVPAIPDAVESEADDVAARNERSAGDDDSIPETAVARAGATDQVSTTLPSKSGSTSADVTPAAAKVRRPRWLIPAAVTVLLATAIFALVRLADSPPTNADSASVIDEGYALLAGDLHASLADTPKLIQEALKNESQGERPRAQDLLRAVHRADSATPIPAIFLALWSTSAGKLDEAEDWITQARERSKATDGLYIPLLLAYVQSEIADDPAEIISTGGALLDLRPKAWRMRAARGHLMEYIGMRPAALREFQQIEIHALGHNKLDMALADRASLGDLAGAQAVLDRLPATQSPLSFAYVSGRLAWTRGDYAGSRAQFLAATQQTYDNARIDLYAGSVLSATMLAVLFDDDDEALELVSRGRSVLNLRSVSNDIDLSLFAAELLANSGDSVASGKELERALASAPMTRNALMPMIARFAQWRLRPGTTPEQPEFLNADAQALWRSAQALAGGDAEAAKAALLEARQAGINNTRLADEARWLELQLGLPVSEQSILDPPLAPLSRVVLRRQIRRALAEQGISLGAARP